MRERKIEKYLIKSPKQMIMVVTLFTLMIFVGGTTYAFFNYTRTGGANSIRVGRISFNHTQDGTITLTNIFPMTSEEFENSTIDPSNNVTINIEGDTTYPNGIEYLVTAEDVNITVNDKRIPLTLKVTSTTDLGDNDEDYFTNRGESTNIHKVLSGGVVVDGQYLVVGYIAPGQTGVEGSLNISAYINSDNIVISDTYDGTESDNMGTTNEWVGNKTVFTTSEWNSLSTSSNSLSFKIRVEANEGIWVDPYTTPNLMNYVNINRNAVNIKEIRFIEETPLRMQRRYDASVGQESNGTKADLTYQETGKVLAWIEPVSVNPTGTSSNLNIKPSFLVNENTDNNLKQIDDETSYILYIASSGKTKWVTAGIFGGFTSVEKITFENVDSSDVTSMSGMFPYLSNLKSIVGINKLDTSNVTNMSGMFNNCTNLVSIDLSGMGSNNLTSVGGMFSGCTSLTTINMENFNFGVSNISTVYSPFISLSNVEIINLNNANVENVTDMNHMFMGDTNLRELNLNNLNTERVTDMGGMFQDCVSLQTLNLNSFNTNNVKTMNEMFMNCSSLQLLNLNSFNTSNVISMYGMFENCTKLQTLDLSTFDTSKVKFMYRMFAMGTYSSATFTLTPSNNTLTTIVVGNGWDTRLLEGSQHNDMFYNCIHLVGGAGTTFDSTAPIDKTRAIIDGGQSNPGYLTLKQA